MLTVPATPAVLGDGKPWTVNDEAAAAFTCTPLCPPVIVLVTVSVAVTDCEPAVFNVTPLVKEWGPSLVNG